MEDYIALSEIYVYDSKLFKSKNLKSFVRNHKIQENDMVKLKANKIGIKKNWIKKNLPSFNLKLEEFVDDKNSYFEVHSTLEKYGCKIFNPVTLSLDSTMVRFFTKDGKRTPYFTKKGLMKIMVLFNAVPENIFNWVYELVNGCMQAQLDNLSNISEMVNLNHIPVVKTINGKMVLSSHVYSIDKDDIVVDFKRVGDLKKEANLNQTVEGYKCPLFSQIQTNFHKGLIEAEQQFDLKVKDLKQEKVIQHLQQELEKEKCLKDQAISLTQSFIPGFNTETPKRRCSASIGPIDNGETKPSMSPIPPPKTFSGLGKLKPSKIH